MIFTTRVGSSVILKSLRDRKSTRLNSSHTIISYAVFCLKTDNLVAESVGGRGGGGGGGGVGGGGGGRGGANAGPALPTEMNFFFNIPVGQHKTVLAIRDFLSI